MPHELPKAYDPSAIEARWGEYWVKERLFATPDDRGWEGKLVFCTRLPGVPGKSFGAR